MRAWKIQLAIIGPDVFFLMIKLATSLNISDIFSV